MLQNTDSPMHQMLHNILLLSRWQKALQLLLLIKRFKLFLQVLDNPMHIIKQYPFCKPLSCPLFFLLLRHLTMYPDMTYRKLLADILQCYQKILILIYR